eukprot:TRINITY_DN42_c0_g1_i2.p3 TRINITY_DN42_c0_g1~~TRINITY_DN42_c0_g1_i2.p3  ORF type:complete len:178 (+),score=17.08 TRINITY_DN42_c0_g1_i2:986-1519(+)
MGIKFTKRFGRNFLYLKMFADSQKDIRKFTQQMVEKPAKRIISILSYVKPSEKLGECLKKVMEIFLEEGAKVWKNIKVEATKETEPRGKLKKILSAFKKLVSKNKSNKEEVKKSAVEDGMRYELSINLLEEVIQIFFQRRQNIVHFKIAFNRALTHYEACKRCSCHDRFGENNRRMH